ncbi:hypothetical protein ACFL27_10490 [candidate division CSSED10-310 bacterium]|uniref:DUF3298 domain-containing protein n=1 Tax=candidate division CSSED10-310 bacterium TaxID=2855610 RepID=A0ABV6YWM2_UNCC1
MVHKRFVSTHFILPAFRVVVFFTVVMILLFSPPVGGEDETSTPQKTQDAPDDKYDELRHKFDELLKKLDAIEQQTISRMKYQQLYKKLEGDLNTELGLTEITIGEPDVQFQSDIMQFKIYSKGLYLGEIIARADPFDEEKFMSKAKKLLQFDEQGRHKLFHELQVALNSSFSLKGLSLSKPTFMFEVDIEKITIFHNKKFVGDLFLRLYPFDKKSFVEKIRNLLSLEGLITRKPPDQKIPRVDYQKLCQELERDLLKEFGVAGLTIGTPELRFQSDIIQLKLYSKGVYLGDVIARADPFDKSQFINKVGELLQHDEKSLQHLFELMEATIQKELQIEGLTVSKPSLMFETNIMKITIYFQKTFVGDIYMGIYPFHQATFVRKIKELLKLEGYIP